jgi:hypothetical protein
VHLGLGGGSTEDGQPEYDQFQGHENAKTSGNNISFNSRGPQSLGRDQSDKDYISTKKRIYLSRRGT